MDANVHDATSSVVKQLRAQLQEKDRKIRVLDRRLARAAVEAAWLLKHHYAIDEEHTERINALYRLNVVRRDYISILEKVLGSAGHGLISGLLLTHGDHQE